MTKKAINTQEATRGMFSNIGTDETEDKQGTQEKQAEGKRGKGRPKKEVPLRGYRYNLTLDADLNGFLHQIAWENVTSITQYLNDLIRREKEAFIASGKELDPRFEKKGEK